MGGGNYRLKSTTLDEFDDAIELGDKLEDPYNFKNIKYAYQLLKNKKVDMPDIDIKPTHNYLRFLPKNEKEWDVLKKDTNLLIYDYPLDYELKTEGTFYHDPSLPDSTITYQYVVIPIGDSIPNLPYELLYEVYIPEKDTKYQDTKYTNWLDELEYESVKLTGNLPDDLAPEDSTKGWFWPSKWTPKGHIYVWDDILQRSIPLVQATVRARWFVHISKDLTDFNGYFATGRFRYKVNYSIKWERSKFDIRNGNLLQAWYNGPKKRGDWELNIVSGKSLMYATMHRAAYKMFYGYIYGLNRPSSAGKTKLCYIHANGTGVFWGDWIDMGILPDIKIWGKSYGANKTTNIVFATTIHELAHLAHWKHITGFYYCQTSEIVYESWATAVEWYLTCQSYLYYGWKYNNDAAKYYYHEKGKQEWPLEGTWNYSPIFIDLLDQWNQRYGFTYYHYDHNGNTAYPNDNVSGYTLQYINNNILPHARGMHSLRNTIKEYKISGVTDADIEELFAVYW